MSTSGSNIDNVMHENRKFPPTPEFASASRIGSFEAYQELYQRSVDQPEQFWSETANEELHWFQPFDSVCQQDGGNVRWFEGGKTNALRR